MSKRDDIITPRDGQTPLSPGQYRVVSVGPTIAHLSRIVAEDEEEGEWRPTRTTIFPVGLLDLCDIELPEPAKEDT